MPSQFNELIQSKSIASITPQQILAAGSPVFLDINTNADIMSINRLVQAYGRIHAPTYGQPIPMTGKISQIVGDGNVLEPSSNEIARVVSIQASNLGGAPIEANITIGGLVVDSLVINPGATTGSLTARDLPIDKNLPIGVEVTLGDPNDLSTSVISILMVQ